jgi:hypothetical protein
MTRQLGRPCAGLFWPKTPEFFFIGPTQVKSPRDVEAILFWQSESWPNTAIHVKVIPGIVVF